MKIGYFEGLENPLPEAVFIDIEASGFGEKSYPIEVGWATCDLRSAATLIKPVSLWDDWTWMPESEKIHGIPRGLCVREGMDVVAVAKALNAEFAGKLVFSDAVDYDGFWLDVLFRAANIVRGFPLLNAWQLLRDMFDAPPAQATLYAKLAVAQAERVFPHTHRADEDSLGWAAAVRLIGNAPLPDPATRIVR